MLGPSRKLRHGTRGIAVQGCQVQLLVRRCRPVFYPACPLRIVVDTISIAVMGSLKAVRLQRGLPVRLQIGEVPRRTHIILHGQQKERRGIGRSVLIRQLVPCHIPGKLAGRLRELMRHLAIRTLPSNQKAERPTRQRRVSIAVNRIHRPQGVPPKEPPKAGPRGVKRRKPSRHKTRLRRAACRGRDGRLRGLNRQLRPLQRPVDLRLRRMRHGAVVKEVRVVRLRVRIRLRQRPVGREQPPLQRGHPGPGVLFPRPPHLAQQREQVIGIARRIEVHAELNWQRTRVLLVRRKRAGARTWHANHPEHSRVVGSQLIHATTAQRPPPPARLAGLRRGPHPYQRWRQRNNQRRRMDRLDLKHDLPAKACVWVLGIVRIAGRHKHMLAHGDRGMGVSKRCVIGRDLEIRSQGIQLNRHRIALHFRTQVQRRKQLHRQLPQLHGPILHAKNRTGAPRHRYRMARQGGLVNRQCIVLREGEPCRDLKGLRCLRQGRHPQQKRAQNEGAKRHNRCLRL